MQKAWFHSDQQHTAFRLRLFPLDLGHLFLLRSLESPFLLDSESEAATLYDGLIFSAVVCSPFDRSNKRILSTWFNTWLRCVRFISRKCKLRTELKNIHQYLFQEYEFLKMGYKASDSNKTKWDSETPQEYLLLYYALSCFGMSVDQAMRTNIRMLSNLIAIKATQTGDSAILTSDQLKVVEKVNSLKKGAA